MKMLVAYDGTLQSKDALRFGLGKAREEGARLLVLHVFNGNVFIDYGAGPGAVELARAESARAIEEAKAIIKTEGSGVQTRVFSTEGEPEESVLDFARSEGVDTVICPPRYSSIIQRYRKVLDEQGKAAESVVMGVGKRGAVSVLGVRAA